MREQSDKPQPSQLSRGAAMLMIGILAAMVLLSIYANVQKARRGKIESVTITAAPSASPSPR